MIHTLAIIMIILNTKEVIQCIKIHSQIKRVQSFLEYMIFSLKDMIHFIKDMILFYNYMISQNNHMTPFCNKLFLINY